MWCKRARLAPAAGQRQGTWERCRGAGILGYTEGTARRLVFSSSELIRAQGQDLPSSSRPTTRPSGTLFALVEGLFATLFPSDCRLCNAPLENISRLPVCPDCLARIAPARGPACFVCGERMLAGSFQGGDAATAAAGEAPGRLCGMCERARPAYERALAYGAYDGALRDLIHLLKYARVQPAAAVLGRMLAEAIAGLEIAAERVLVVPVPLYAGKQRQRGFNQAQEITRAALKLMAPLSGGKYRPAAERLLRVRDTLSQTGLTRHQRRENVRGAFVAVDPEKLEGATVLLVDDVMTTGTTVAECAKVLRRAGAEKVFVATVARVLKYDAAFAAPEEGLRTSGGAQDEPTTKSMTAYA